MAKKSKGLVNGGDGLVHLVHSALILIMSLLSGKGLLIKVLSVLLNVGLKLSKTLLKSLPLRNKHVVNHVVTIEEVSISILNVLFESGNISVVVVCSSLEVLVNLFEFGIELFNQLIDF